MADKLTRREKDQRQRSRINNKLLKHLVETWQRITGDNTEALRAIPDEVWQKAQAEDDLDLETAEGESLVPTWVIGLVAAREPEAHQRNWQEQVSGMTRVQKLVHLAKRFALDETQQLRSELLRDMRLAYQDELTIQARRMGCNRQGLLRNGPILSQLNDLALVRAGQIANTYNYDLSIAIQAIYSRNPRANRHYYARWLETWEEYRAAWKLPQINQHQTGEARALAQQHFYEHNGQQGYAVLIPRTAVCPICQGWINRGKVPMRVAMSAPPPYHVNCPHLWDTYPDKAIDCDLLWMGE